MRTLKPLDEPFSEAVYILCCIIRKKGAAIQSWCSVSEAWKTNSELFGGKMWNARHGLQDCQGLHIKVYDADRHPVATFGSQCEEFRTNMSLNPYKIFKLFLLALAAD